MSIRTASLALAAAMLTHGAGHASEFTLPVVRDSVAELQALRDDGGVSFRGAADEQRFARVLQQLARLSQDLGGGGGGELSNVRKQAAALLTAALDVGDVRKAISKLPEVVTEDDLAFLQRAGGKQASTWMPLIIQSYFHNTSEQDPRNFRGRAAGGMSQAMEAKELYEALKSLPAFCGADDARFLAWLASTSSGTWMKLQLQGYFKNPATRDRRNRKGTAARILCESLDDGQRYELFKELPEFIGEADLPMLQLLAQKETGAMLVFKAKQYFRNRG